MAEGFPFFARHRLAAIEHRAVAVERDGLVRQPVFVAQVCAFKIGAGREMDGVAGLREPDGEGDGFHGLRTAIVRVAAGRGIDAEFPRPV